MSKIKIEIVQIKSAIGHNLRVKKTLEALGLKMNHTIVKDDSPALRGMINRVGHLIQFKEIK